MSDSPAACLAAEILEGIAAGQSVPPAAHAHLAVCEGCRQTLQRIREDNRFLGEFAVGGVLRGAAPPGDLAPAVPGYEIVREIHRGGQGVVYQAVQRATKRAVAIKVMKQGPFATLADRARFDREIETLGKLNHPNIVAVHDAGAAAGVHYFVMNYVDGRPLDEAILEFGFWNLDLETPAARADQPAAQAHSSMVGPLPSKIQNPKSKMDAVLALFIKICDAVHAAHLRGVIHRDLKPSNIRVDRAGEPYVLDFGLAKLAETEGESAMTHTGQFVGSLPWASPEQVEGAAAKIDLRTDVYSLGVILFQMLAGKLPFDLGSNLRENVDHILFHDPPRPSAAAWSTRGLRLDDELDTIILRCLAKDRERRYQSAGELARDLGRYLAGEPIEAKRDSAMYMLRKTLRRYRLRVAAAGAFVVLLGVLSVVMTVLYRRSARLEREALRSAVSLRDLLAESNIERGRMAGLLGNAEQAEQLLWGELLTRRETGETAISRLNDPPGPPEAYWALWEFYRRHPCLRTLVPSKAPRRTATAAEEDGRLWTVDSTGWAQKLDDHGVPLDSYRVTLPNVTGLPAVDARGELLFHYDGHRYRVWRRGGALPALELPPVAANDPDALCVSRSGKRFALRLDGAAVIWNTESFTEIGRFAGPDVELAALAISNDDRRLAARDRWGGLLVWDIDTRRLVAQVRAAPPRREAAHTRGELLFSPDDRLLADAWLEITGRIWNLETVPPAAIELAERSGDYRRQSFSPDGRLLAVGDVGGGVRVFETHTGQRLLAFAAHAGRLRGLGFAGGQRLWTCADAEIRWWEIPADAGVHILRPVEDLFHCVEPSPDGRWLAAGGGSGKLHWIERASGSSASVPFGNTATLSSLAFSPDAGRLAGATYANAAYVWSLDRLDRPLLQLAHPNFVSCVCFSPDGARLATACDDALIRLWRVADGALEGELRGCADRVPQVAFDPAGERLAAAVRNGSLLVWNLKTGECATWASATRSPLRGVRFSRDGRWLVAAGADRAVQIWDAAEARCVARLAGHNQEIYCLDLHPQNGLIATGDSGGVIRLWHLELRKPLATLEGHGGAVMALRFTPDGQTLVSASLDGTLREWNLTHYERHIAGQVEARLNKLELHPDDAPQAAAWRAWAAQLDR